MAREPYVTYALIAINVVVYLLQVESGDRITLAFACTPWEVTHNEDLDAPVARPPSIVRIQDPAGRARTFTFDHGWIDVADVDADQKDLED